VGGHSGVPPTGEHNKQLFVWPKLKENVQFFMVGCTVCQQEKTENVKASGLLHPLPVPSTPWEMIILDFTEEFPNLKIAMSYWC
jgi:hypothetical protein